MIGLGNFGTAIGNLIASNGYDVLGWDINDGVVDDINQNHRNTTYLKGVDLSPKLSATHNIADVLADCPILFIAIPARFIHDTLATFTPTQPSPICVNMAKGIDLARNQTASEILRDLLPIYQHFVLSGPSIANEFAQGLPTKVVIAGKDKGIYERIASLLKCNYFATEYSNDIIGTEWGGIIKNAYTIGLGLLHGSTGVNFQALYLTKALAEMGTVFEIMGSAKNASYHLSGVGDFMATALSKHSHNRAFGISVASNADYLEQALAIGDVPEGYFTLQHILNVTADKHMQLPLAKNINDLLDKHITQDEFIQSLL